MQLNVGHPHTGTRTKGAPSLSLPLLSQIPPPPTRRSNPQPRRRIGYSGQLERLPTGLPLLVSLGPAALGKDAPSHPQLESCSTPHAHPSSAGLRMGLSVAGAPYCHPPAKPFWAKQPQGKVVFFPPPCGFRRLGFPERESRFGLLNSRESF